MKGNISLTEFIKEVKDDLRSAVDENDPFFIMDAVELEVSFGLDIEAKAGAKFVVFDLSSKAKAQQTHKVKINLTPFVIDNGERKTTNKTKAAPNTIKKPTAKAKTVTKSRSKPTAKSTKVVRSSGDRLTAKKAAAKKSRTPKKK